MSVANVKAFFQELQKNGELRAKLKASGARDKAEAARNLVRIAAEAGFEFTEQEYETATQAHAGPPRPVTKPSA